jgi:hypothetical protein
MTRSPRLSPAVLPIVACAATLLVCGGGVAQTSEDFERPPVEYSQRTPDNAVTRLQAKLDAGASRLAFDKTKGYLPALLEALEVPIESQTLVFSKTSLQRARISPRTPRAVYFSDDVYIGFCRAGEVLEIAAADAELGTVFYTLDQQPSDAPRFARQTDSCLVCHSSSRTEGVPGLLLRSLAAGPTGEPILSEGSKTVDYRTPLEDRWGGWYVTGTHGAQQHRGNVIARRGDRGTTVDGQNVTSLADRFSVDQYLSPHSDIVGLMVLEHQVFMQNALTKANFDSRAALFYQAEFNRALGNPEGAPLDSATSRIENAADKLVEALLLMDEAPLRGPIRGTSGFREAFEALGPKDKAGRSLRELDLERRLFKYPCSYLIYSESFDRLPAAVRARVWQRLGSILSGDDSAGRFQHLTAEQRHSIAAILRETKADLPADWP